MSGMPRRVVLAGGAAAVGGVVGSATNAASASSASAPSASANGTLRVPESDCPRENVTFADVRDVRDIRTGAEVAAADHWATLRGSAVGVFSNPTGILRDTRHIVDDLAGYDEVRPVAAFGPEHGFRGSAQAGGSEGDTTDPRTGIPVYDAYGADIAKLKRLFVKAGLETMVFDIQDIGARFYTYIWTMYQAMAAAAELGLRFVVLDRPNPIGGRAEGPMMTPGYTSGVGLKEIIQQHGMTIGELARFFNGEFIPDETGRPVELEVVRMRGWRPGDRAQDLGLPWVPPSPNIPTPDSALVYPGTGLFEGTNLSEGRGTTRPFEFIGAPFLDYRWGDRLNDHGLPGVEFREAYFVPTFDKHEGAVCAGVQLHLTDVYAYRPIPTAVAMLVEARRYNRFAWREDDYDPDRPFWVDKLTGSPRLRTMIDAGASADEVVGAWADETSDFDRRRQPYLLYSGSGIASDEPSAASGR